MGAIASKSLLQCTDRDSLQYGSDKKQAPLPFESGASRTYNFYIAFHNVSAMSSQRFHHKFR